MTLENIHTQRDAHRHTDTDTHTRTRMHGRMHAHTHAHSHVRLTLTHNVVSAATELHVANAYLCELIHPIKYT